MSDPAATGNGSGVSGAPDAQAVARKGPSRRRVVITAIVGVVVMIAVFALLIPQLGSYEEAFAELGRMPVSWLIVLVLVGIANIALYPTTVLVSVDGLRYWPGFVERQVGFLVSNCLPGGGVFAVGFQYRVLAFYRVSPAMSAAAVTSDAVWTYLITLGLPSIAVALLVVSGEKDPGLTTVAAVGLLAVAVSVALIALVLHSERDARKVGRFAARLARPVFRKLGRPEPAIETSLVAFRSKAHDLIVRKWRMLTLANVGTQLMPFLIVLCALGGLGAFPGTLTIIEVFAAYAIAQLLVSIPITPGGLGTVDAALVAMLTALGASGPVAVAADLMWRLVWFLPQMVAGAVALIAFVIEQRLARRRGQPAPLEAR